MNKNFTIALIAVVLSLAFSANHYRDNAIEYKKQRDEKVQALKQANAIITDMQVRQRDVAELDARYTKELADAKTTIESLSADVAAGRRRLYLNATCTGKTDTAASSGMVNAPTARPADSAARDYFTLRAGIETVTKQVEGLQEYINTQCLK